MPLIRPSLIIQAYLTPDNYSESTVKEFKRSYIYQAQSLVKPLAEDELQDGNVLRLSIRLMRPYWDSSDAQAQRLWEGVMPQWLKNVTYNVSNAMVKYNQVIHPFGCGRLDFSWVDFEFDNNALLRVKVENNLIPECMPQLVEKARDYFNAGAFGEGEVALVRLPSRASYEAQRKAFAEAECAYAEGRCVGEDSSEEPVGALSQATEPELAAEASVADARGLAQADSEDAGKEEVFADGAAGEGFVSAGEAAEAPAEGQTEDVPSRKPVFKLDYRTWGVEYVGGTIKEFNTEQA